MSFQPFLAQAKALFPWSLQTSSSSTRSSSSGSSSAARNRSASIISYQAPPKSEVISTTTGHYDTSLAAEERISRRIYGLVPPAVESHKTQIERCLKILDLKSTPIEKYHYLTHLRATNVHLFYRLLVSNIKEITPLIYTPTVGEACLRWSELYTQPEGLYISYDDRGRIEDVLNNWPHKVEITVITDGSRILGLGDLGINGMGIPVGKLALYTACAGIKPHATLPLTLDLGTNNEKLREDPLYMGSRRAKVSAEEEMGFLDEMMEALTKKWPGIIIQFEDFKNPFPALERYKNRYTCFNDDVQGTGAVVLAGIMNAIKKSGVPVKDHRAVFLGAGSAGVGVARQIVEYFIKEGLSEKEAREKFWFVDSQGLVTASRPGCLASHKTYFARTDNDGQEISSLSSLIETVRPTMLLGLSTIGGAFTPQILTKMAHLNARPIIFPLSNPSSKSECSLADAVRYTEGRCIFASGSPFDPVTFTPNNNTATTSSPQSTSSLTPPDQFQPQSSSPLSSSPSLPLSSSTRIIPSQQGNNMYIFPALGLAAVLAHTAIIPQAMVYAAAASLAESLDEAERADPYVLYPDLARIREVSVAVARGVIRAAQREGVDRNALLREMGDEDDAEGKNDDGSHGHDRGENGGGGKRVEGVVRECMYDPFQV